MNTLTLVYNIKYTSGQYIKIICIQNETLVGVLVVSA